MRVGFAKDIHKFQKEGKFFLGGVLISDKVGITAHSDGDVVLHAVGESILGALALGDLGTFFPDNDKTTLGMDSKIILKFIKDKMDSLGYKINNLDVSIELDTIKIASFIQDIRKSLALLLDTDINNVSVKAMTNEGLDSTGNGLAVIAYSIVSLCEVEK